MDCSVCLEDLLNNLPVEVVVRDAESVILFANKAFGQTYGKPINQLIGRRDADFWVEFGRSNEEIEKWLAEDKEILRSGNKKEYVDRIVRPNGDIAFFSNIKQAITLENGTRCLLAIYSEVTQQKNEEAGLAEELARSSEMLGIHKATVTLCHEVNNPLTGILGLSQMLLEDNRLPADQKEMALEIRDAANRIKQATSQLESIDRLKMKPYLGKEEIIDLD